MKHLLLSSALTVAALSSATWAEERSIEITVGELTCPSCSFIVASALRSVPSVEINGFEDGPADGQGIYTVSFEDTETTVESIVGAVTANGYPVSVLPEVDW
ncbi:heavy-metal-associated domain-containing protein [Yoonia sp.]|uniref:heavy-metal-associated domain-containing protein n=1 Tax=Yoonia sp. TaxID=2212373 RepID=UPI0035C80A93